VSVARPGDDADDADAAATAADVGAEDYWEEEAGWDAASRLAKPKQRRFFKQSPTVACPKPSSRSFGKPTAKCRLINMT